MEDKQAGTLVANPYRLAAAGFLFGKSIPAFGNILQSSFGVVNAPHTT